MLLQYWTSSKRVLFRCRVCARVFGAYIGRWRRLWQAFIFWVVDNFLKRKVMRPTGQHQIDSDASAARYFSAIEMLKFYKRVTPAAADSDSEMLLAREDESDGSQGRGAGRRRSNSQSSERNKLTAVVT